MIETPVPSDFKFLVEFYDKTPETRGWCILAHFQTEGEAVAHFHKLNNQGGFTYRVKTRFLDRVIIKSAA